MHPLVDLGLHKARNGGPPASPHAVVLHLENLEERIAPSTFNQLITIKSASGAPLSGATVAIYDAVSCQAPKTTNSNGQVSFTVNTVVKSILITKVGYTSKSFDVNSSSLNYSISLDPLPSTPKISNWSIAANRAFSLLSMVGLKPLGTYTVNQLLAVGTLASLATAGTCTGLSFFPPATAGAVPCAGASWTTFVAVEAVKSAIAAVNTLGWGNLGAVKVNVYFCPLTQTLVCFKAA